MVVNPAVNSLLQLVLSEIEIPRSYYEKAVARHRSLGEWLCRSESAVAAFSPVVVPQGSFRFGTVVRPVVQTQKYDLDNATTLQVAKTQMSQKNLKHLYGAEIKAYAIAHNMTDPIEERNRCWRVFYADAMNFHLDSLPCIPEDKHVVGAIVEAGCRRALRRSRWRSPTSGIRTTNEFRLRFSVAIRGGLQIGLKSVRADGLCLA
jgi:Cyclic GMP-AMP synthase DncV-like, nucleotidyltransferase domain